MAVKVTPTVETVDSSDPCFGQYFSGKDNHSGPFSQRVNFEMNSLYERPRVCKSLGFSSDLTWWKQISVPNSFLMEATMA